MHAREIFVCPHVHIAVLILDEPTAGVDAGARRHVWNALAKYKSSGRSIVLATHHCDEASLLGDRVILLARGRLRVAGSPLFLKSRYGLGYHLTVVVAAPPADDFDSGTGDASVSAMWTASIQRLVPGASLRSARRTNNSSTESSVAPEGAGMALEMAFVLPQPDVEQIKQGTSFANLFSALEALQAGARQLQCNSSAALPSVSAADWPPQALLMYAVNITTLEEVFLRLTELLDQEEAAERDARAAASALVADGVLPSGKAPGTSTPAVSAVAHSGASPLTDWWLDVRRRLAYKNSTSGVKAGDVESDSYDAAAYLARLRDAGIRLPAVVPGRQYPRASFGALYQQVVLQVRRRFRQARRDVRGVALQSVVPLIFIGISGVFRVLSVIGTTPTFHTAAFDASTFADPLNAPGAPSAWVLPWTTFDTSVPAFDAYVNTTVGAFPPPTQPSLFPGTQPESATAASAAIAAGSWAAGALLLSAQSFGSGPYLLTLMYNSTLTQVLPTLLSLWDSAVLAGALNLGGTPRLISASYDPLPPSPDDVGSAMSSLGDYLAPSLIGMYTSMGLLMIPAAIANKVVAERVSRAKQVQLIAGASNEGYWLSMFIWDVAMWLPTWFAACIILAAVLPPALRAASSYSTLIAILFAAGCAFPVPTYVASFAFTKAADAQLGVRIAATLILIVLFAISIPLTLPGLGDINATLTSVAKGFDYLGMLFPPYALTRAFSVIGVASVCSPAIVAAGMPCTLANPLSWDVGGRFLVFIIASIPIWAAVLMWVERAREPARSPRGGSTAMPAPRDRPTPRGEANVAASGYGSTTNASLALIEDEDVSRERALLRQGGVEGRGANLEILGLRKEYPASGGRLKVAVADLWLHVGEGDVFGLLGANGAGKSTTIAMAVGDTTPTDGDVLLCGDSPAKARRDGLLGFCPQIDALFENFTTSEHIAFYGALSGMPAEHVPALVAAAIEALDLGPHANTLSQHLSGGNKRRLSLVLAYVGAPRVVLIDEPTTGTISASVKLVGGRERMGRCRTVAVYNKQ